MAPPRMPIGEEVRGPKSLKKLRALSHWPSEGGHQEIAALMPERSTPDQKMPLVTVLDVVSTQATILKGAEKLVEEMAHGQWAV